MPTPLNELFPDVPTTLAMPLPEIAGSLLRLAAESLQNGIFSPGNLNDQIVDHFREALRSIPEKDALRTALSEGWAWLNLQILTVPAPGKNGTNGFQVVSREGRRLLERGQFSQYRRVSEIPESLLHPAIFSAAWHHLTRQEFDTAVFNAFKAVEVAVRDAAKLTAADIGTKLMRKAFDVENGQLTDKTTESAERQALSDLFAGAIGSYKNPHSHRNVALNDASEALEMVLLASHLMKIVDSRR